MTRKRAIKNQDQELRTLRRLFGRIEEAVDAAPPEKAAALLPRMADLAERLANAEAEEARENFAAGQRDYDAEVERLIDERAQEQAEWMLNPPDWEFDNRAKAIALREGGNWPDHLPRVRAEHGAFIRSLIDRAQGCRGETMAEDGE